MSHVPAHLTRGLLKSVTSHLAGKSERGPDNGPDRRVPHRESFDVADPRARPWSRIGDGSVGQGIAHREALIEAAEEQYHRGWQEHPGAAIRAARARRDALQAELAAYESAAPATVPVGRPAAVRLELAKLAADLARADQRLRRVDLTVLKALLRYLDFATGQLFPTLDTIARTAGCHVNAVKLALKRLRAHGLLAWRRRTIRTGSQGVYGPQREQTSNAYFFEHRARMPRRLWQRYSQLLTMKLRRLGKVPSAIQPPPEPLESLEPPARTPPPQVGVAGLRSAVSSLGASVCHART